MDFVSLVLIGIGLAIDSVTVSICTGLTMKRTSVWYATRVAFVFGFFQAAMPVLGWAAGLSFRDLIESYDHWIAFGLLAIIGAKMIWDAFQADACERCLDLNRLGLLLTLGVATSIDALAVGLGFSVLQVSIGPAVAIIGVVTFGMSFTAVLLGKHLGGLLRGKASAVGGIVLVAIGIRIVIEHVAAAGAV